MAARLLALGLLLSQGTTIRLVGKVHPWPCKNGNLMRTGQGQFSGAGPRSLAKAAWVFETPQKDASFYQSSVIDGDRNTYFSSTKGILYSMAPNGKLNWEIKLPRESRKAGQMPTPVLSGDVLYTVDGQGWLVAVGLASGKELWRTQFSFASGDDSWSMGLDEKTATLFAVGFPDARAAKACQWGGTHLYALDLHDGHRKWSYQMKACNCNMMPSVVGDLVLLSDQTGNTYALDVGTGQPRWTAPGNGMDTFTTGTAAVGENGLVYVASNLQHQRGVIRAYDVQSGSQVWQRIFDREANNAPAVYRDRQGRLLVSVGISNNPGLPLPWLEGRVSMNSTVFAIDAATGETVWEFSPPAWKHPSSAGSTFQQLCMPDAFTNPSVDTSGTMYIGWMGGMAYSIDGTTGKLLSSWETGSGMQGAPAIADGMLAVTSCQRMAGFVHEA